MHRQYHNTTAKYNGYFNGKESMKMGVKKIKANHKDDYTTILSVYKMGDLAKAKKTHSYMDKAIKKGSVVIQRHSIKIKGKEYCKWIDENYLLVGKAYFYKGEYDEAIKTFSFIKNEYKKNESRFDASLWLIRSYVQKEDFITAEMELEELENERKFPKRLEKEKLKVKADYYLKQNNFSLALEELKSLEEKIRRKRKKVRYNYIIAQIYQQHNNHKKAQYHFEKTLKSPAEYEMIFNAKMNLARSMESGGKGADKMYAKLLKMTKDEKNKEYLDQIYYTLAEIDINNTDTTTAIENYKLSTINSINNDNQKALSFLSLGEIEYNKAKYPKAKICYDSTIYYMEEEFRTYKETQKKHNILVDLVANLEVISLEDSLQFLARLPKAQRDKIISQVIQKEIEREKQEMNTERTKQQMMYESNRNNMRGEQFGNNTSGGKWYFYNPATLSFGMSEFRKKWGKRKLEDDWRRKDKKLSENFQADTSLEASEAPQRKEQSKKDPKYYLDQLPKKEEDFAISDAKIKEAIYQVAIIYKEELQEYQKSAKMFMEIPSRYPQDKEYSSLAYYNVYKNYLQQNQLSKAEKIKELLASKYPNSICAKLLIEPNFEAELIATKNEPETNYQLVYNEYRNQNYNQVISSTSTIKEDQYKLKYMFLRALSFQGIKDTNNFKKELKLIITTDPSSIIAKQSKEVLETIKDPSKMQRSNELALASSPYIFKENIKHAVLVLLPKQGIDINYLKTIVSDYHANEFSNEVFEISAMLMGLENHLMMIKTFNNASEAISYSKILSEAEAVNKVLETTNYKIITISLENFKEFYKNKDVKGYHAFFQENYLKE